MNNIQKYWKIDAPENENIRSMLSLPPEYYEKRLRKIGFVGKDKTLLDAACGAGHWAIVASQLNKKVDAIDAMEKYLSVGKEIKDKLKIKNLKFKIGKMESLPYKDNSFDYIISYCAWMYTERAKSLKEMTRVLKPGGKIYLGAIAGFGWYLKLIWQAILRGDRSLLITSLRAIINRIYTNESETRRLFKKNNLGIVGLSSDADLGDSKIIVKPIYEDKILSFWNVYEVLAIKEKGV